jgi:hypothetical protein
MNLKPLILIATAATVATTGCGAAHHGADASATQAKLIVAAPLDGSSVASKHLVVRGTVSPASAQVDVLGQPAQVSGGMFSASVRLRPGGNRIDVVASGAGVEPRTMAITITRRSVHRRHTRTQPQRSYPVALATTPQLSGSCGDGIIVNSATSCPFAIRVRDAYASDGGPVVYVYSPVTGQTYAMTCTPGPDAQTTCRGGDNAVVVF